MGELVCRLGDQFETGHPECEPISTLGTASPDVFVGGLPVVRQGDLSVVHDGRPGCVPHVVPVIGGSSTVMVNGRPVARVTDEIDFGKIIEGDATVIIG